MCPFDRGSLCLLLGARPTIYNLSANEEYIKSTARQSLIWWPSDPTCVYLQAVPGSEAISSWNEKSSHCQAHGSYCKRPARVSSLSPALWLMESGGHYLPLPTAPRERPCDDSATAIKSHSRRHCRGYRTHCLKASPVSYSSKDP